MDFINLELKEMEKIYGKISPFEFKNKLIQLATDQKKNSTRTLLDAGRGNPNWTASTPRDAFFTFGHFAVSETRRNLNDKDLAGMPQKQGIYDRFCDFLNKNSSSPGHDLLKNIIDYGITKFNFNEDDWVYELADGIIGDNYPFPDRMLNHIEKIVHSYLLKEMCYNNTPNKDFKLFAVEGATAGMCYIFDSLIANNLIHHDDKIALMTPIFTPYLEIPILPRYKLNIVSINANKKNPDGTHSWQYPECELEKLKDKSIKALFLVNPSNPPSIAMDESTINTIVDIVKNYNPNLMIISDDVYGTFVDNFKSLVSYLPFNSIGVYSFSKYFGVTGWRLGTLALYENNVFDKLLSEFSEEEKKVLNKRYGHLSSTPESLPFIDRIVADSRQVALNHTAGLSTPQQVQMAFFCAFALLDEDNIYKKQTINICHKRQKLLFDSLKIELKNNPYDAAYYTQFDLLELAYNNYGKDFAEYLKNNYKPVDILFKLAQESSIVLLSGSGFNGPEWSIRISLANLEDEAYSTIGTVLKDILENLVDQWKKQI